jgi:hypothetical protein
MDEEGFWARWARRKQDQATETAAQEIEPAQPAASVPSLPPLEELTFQSDYNVFLQAGVPAATRRAALKKLFADAHFNQLDRLDIHMEDYNLAAPLSAGLLSALQHVPAALRPPEAEPASPAASSDDETGAGNGALPAAPENG